MYAAIEQNQGRVTKSNHEKKHERGRWLSIDLEKISRDFQETSESADSDTGAAEEKQKDAVKIHSDNIPGYYLG
jgi:hypothetical protein